MPAPRPINGALVALYVIGGILTLVGAILFLVAITGRSYESVGGLPYAIWALSIGPLALIAALSVSASRHAR